MLAHRVAGAEVRVAEFRNRLLRPLPPDSPWIEELEGEKRDLATKFPDVGLARVDNFAKVICVEELTMSKWLRRAQELHDAIRKILLHDWDPIGVQDIIEAQDEYDSYVPTIYGMLIHRKPVNEVADYLYWLESEHMGLLSDRQNLMVIAKKLADLVAWAD